MYSVTGGYKNDCVVIITKYSGKIKLDMTQPTCQICVTSVKLLTKTLSSKNKIFKLGF